jgi:hypothetical protein
VIQLLGRRHDTTGSGRVLPYSGSAQPEIRQAALDYLARFGGDAHLGDLLMRLRQAESSAALKALEKTVVQVASRTSDPAATAARVAAVMEGSRPAVHSSLLRVLGSLGGERALELVRRDLWSETDTIKEAALDALLAWPDALAIPDLRRLAGPSPDARQQILALRSLIRVIGIEGSRAPADTMSLYRQAWDLATRAEERRWILSGVSEVEDLSALDFVTGHLDDDDVKAEAEVAAVKLGGALLPSHRDQAAAVLRRVQQQTANQELKRQIRRTLK